MRIQSIHTTNFKRFTDLTIKDIPFDAFEQVGWLSKGNLNRQDDYIKKDPSRDWAVEITDHNDQVYHHNNRDAQETLYYIRLPYRYSREIRISALQTQWKKVSLCYYLLREES